MRLYHPVLKRTVDVPDVPEFIAVQVEAGWGKTIPPDHVDPALAEHQPDAVYQLVPAGDERAEPAPRKRRARSTSDEESAESD